MDIHNYRRRLDRALEKIKDSNIPEENKKAITDFVSNLLGKNLSIARIEHLGLSKQR